MNVKSNIKRYEPMGFLLAMGMIVIGIMLFFLLYKFGKNAKSGVVVGSVIEDYKWAETSVLFVGVLLMIIAQHFFKRQKNNPFRSLFGMSFFIILFFFAIQLTYFPLKTLAVTSSVEELDYYYGFLISVFNLFLVLGLVGQSVIIYRVYRRVSYIDSFIFSVNPPNILNLQLLVRYMLFMFIMWVSIIIYVKGYAI